MSFNEASFDQLLTDNPTRQYAVYNNRVYDFTGFYTTIGVAGPTSPNNDVRFRNTDDDVADAIVVASSLFFDENHIFDVLDPGNDFTAWGIVDLGSYDPELFYNDRQIRTFLTANTDRYIIRWRDVYYDISFVVRRFKNITNPPTPPSAGATAPPALGTRALYVDFYESTFANNTADVLDNITIFDRLLIQDETTYADITTFIEDPGIGGETAVEFDFNDGAADINIYGRAVPAIPLGTNNFQGTGDSTGLATTISGDGNHMAFARRTIAGDENSSVEVVAYELVDEEWVQYGNVIATTTSVLDVAITLKNNPNTIIDLSDDGTILIIGDHKNNANDGRVLAFEYNGVNAWDPLGTPILGGLGLEEKFGYNVALSGDGNIILASYNSDNTPPGKNVRVYEFQTTDWVLITDDLDPNGPAILSDTAGYGLAVNFDGGVICIGNPIESVTPANNGYFYAFERTGPTTYAIIDARLDAPIGRGVENFGFSLDMESDNVNPWVVVGAPNTMRNGQSVGMVFTYELAGAIEQAGEALVGRPGDRLGFAVSMSEDGRRISATAPFGDIDVSGTVIETGYTQVYEYNGAAGPTPAGIWDYEGQGISLETATALSSYVHMDGDGKRLIVGTPNTAANNGDVRAFTLDLDITPNTPPTVSLSRNAGSPNPNFVLTNGTGVLQVNGGIFPYSVVTNPVVATSGSFLLTPVGGSNTQFQYDFSVNDAFNTQGAFIENVTVEFEDSQLPTASEGMGTIILETTINPPLAFDTPPVATVTRVVGGPATETNLDDQFPTMGGTPAFTFEIDDFPGAPVLSLAGLYGTLDITNTNTGEYLYTPIPIGNPAYPNTVGTFPDPFDIILTDATGDQVVLNFAVTFTVTAAPTAPTLGPIAQAQIDRVVNQTPVETNLTGNLTATGGNPPYTFDIVGGIGTPTEFTGSYGTLRILNDATGAYEYEPKPVTDPFYPNAEGNYTDSFTVRVTDSINATNTTGFDVLFFITNPPQTGGTYQFLPIVNQGQVLTSENSPNINTTNLSGMAAVKNGTAASFGVQGGTPVGANSLEVTTLNGRFEINTITGAFFYDPNFGAIDNTTLAIYTDKFTITSISTSTPPQNASVDYTVTFEIRPQFLLDDLLPPSGQIIRNINSGPGVVQETGTTGFIQPINGTPPFLFGIDGVFPPTGLTTTVTGVRGDLTVNTTSGEYNYVVTNLSGSPGVYFDVFTFSVIDSDFPTSPIRQIDYVVSITIQNTPLGLLPTFRHSTSREIGGYWEFIFHDVYRQPSITPAGVVTVPNTEILVIGETETQGDPIINPDGVIRQVLGESAFDRTNPGDVLAQIKNNTQAILDTKETAGIQTTSIKVTRIDNSAAVNDIKQGVDYIVELSDILSSQHSNFLLNRYRSNVGETMIIMYTNDDVDPDMGSPSLPKIQNQVTRLLDLGVRTIICLMQVIGLDPAITAEKAKIESIQDFVLNSIELNGSFVPANNVLYSVITIFDPTTQRYLNVSGRTVSQLPNSLREIVFNSTVIDAQNQRNLYGALSGVVLIPEDASDSNPLRIQITDVDVQAGEATGEIIYGELSSNTSQFASTRFGAEEENFVIASSTFISGQPAPLGAPNPRVTLRQGSKGQNVSTLKPGDVLFSTGGDYARPRFVKLLVSVVRGFESADITGETLFLRVDDGSRFPNNPVFQGEVVSVGPPIDQKFNSNTLDTVSPVGNKLEFGFDYIVNIKLPTSGDTLDEQAAAGGIERYVDFPRLGFLTLYFARDSGTKLPIFAPYGRGAVQLVSDTIPPGFA